jgi:hypothetical protein
MLKKKEKPQYRKENVETADFQAIGSMVTLGVGQA